jgi:hypothetical protein
MDNNIYQTLEKFKSEKLERKNPVYIYLDETDNKIKERPLSDSAASAYHKSNPAKSIHDYIFGY